MSLDQLRIFLSVAKHLHFTRAAEALYVTQPAVSAAIQSLEDHYGVKLFHRISRQIEITEAGLLLQIEAEKILAQVELTERGLRELSNLQRGELKLGTSLTIGNYWLPEKISHFQRQYPNIVVNCTLANTEEICNDTAAGKFDLGLIEGAVQTSLRSLLVVEPIGDDHLQIIVGKAHPWFNRPSIPISELSKTTWVMRESGSGTQQQLEAALRRWNIEPTQLSIALLLSSGEMVKAVVERGDSAAGISELMIQKEIQLGVLRVVPIVDDRTVPSPSAKILRPFLKIKHRQRFQTQLARAFEESLCCPNEA